MKIFLKFSFFVFFAVGRRGGERSTRETKKAASSDAALRRIRLGAPILDLTASDQIPLNANAVVGSTRFSLFSSAFSANAI